MWQAIWAVTRRCRPDTLQVLKENPPTEENYPSAPAAQLTALNVIAASKPTVRIEDVKGLVNEGCSWVNLFGMPLLFSYPSGLLLRNQDPMATTTIALRSNREKKNVEGSSDNVKISSSSNPPEDPTTCATTPIALDWSTRARRSTVKSRTTTCTRKLSSTTSYSTTRPNYSCGSALPHCQHPRDHDSRFRQHPLAWVQKAASNEGDGDEATWSHRRGRRITLFKKVRQKRTTDATDETNNSHTIDDDTMYGLRGRKPQRRGVS